MKTKKYEAMFLVDSGQTDTNAAFEPIQHVLGRAGAKVLSIKPWDDRRLMYEINGRRRGLYVLAYIEADPSRIAELEHDCQLDERIIRLMVLRRDKLTDAEMNAETPATSTTRPAEVSEGDGERRRDRQEREPASEEAPAEETAG